MFYKYCGRGLYVDVTALYFHIALGFKEGVAYFSISLDLRMITVTF